MINKKIMTGLLSSFLVMGCSTNVVPNSVKEVSISETKEQETVYVAKISEKEGASINFKINIPNTFKTKANVNGTAPKTSADVANYLVYLVKNTVTTGYPAGGDPLGVDKVAGPFTIANTGAPATKLVKFSNVPPVTGAYYVAVKAQDSGSVDLIKNNNGSVTPWGGTTPAKVAVTGGAGVTVSAAYVVSAGTPDVTINLLDAIGAQIDSTLTPTSGALPPAVTAVGL